MTTQGKTLADAILHTVPLVTRYLKGFDDSNHTRQAPGLPNHAAWCLGHLAMTMHRAAEKLDGAELPPADFAPGDPPRADKAPSVFYAESVAFGSLPADDPTRYPSFARSVAIFEAAASRLAGALRAAPDAELTREVQWGAAKTTIASLAARLAFHNGTHAGQIVDLRRALGMGSALT